MDEKDGIIKALKSSNEERQKIIDGLLDCMTRRDEEIIQSRRQIEEAKFVIEHLAKR